MWYSFSCCGCSCSWRMRVHVQVVVATQHGDSCWPANHNDHLKTLWRILWGKQLYDKLRCSCTILVLYGVAYSLSPLFHLVCADNAVSTRCLDLFCLCVNGSSHINLSYSNLFHVGAHSWQNIEFWLITVLKYWFPTCVILQLGHLFIVSHT